LSSRADSTREEVTTSLSSSPEGDGEGAVRQYIPQKFLEKRGGREGRAWRLEFLYISWNSEGTHIETALDDRRGGGGGDWLIEGSGIRGEGVLTDFEFSVPGLKRKKPHPLFRLPAGGKGGDGKYFGDSREKPVFF